MNIADLRKPFPPEKISWRVGPTTQDKKKGQALAYIDARDVMGRLDEVAGAHWQCAYVPMPNGTCCCSIGIKIGDEWVWRANGAINLTDSDKPDQKEMTEKGSYSDAFKRAAVLWGIGQYLYDIESPWVELDDKKRILKSEYPKLMALLRGQPAPASEMQSNVAPVNRAAEWCLKAEKEVLAIRDRAGMAEWSKKNAPAIDKLRATDLALYNAINLKIAMRNDELEAMAA